ncbi:N-6 DNA methylase [Aliinostoc sp. HNIBRCY26]|uniref:N-6 DNA methylase n=1 Tax=Aliinostoc sp. HNIBRCY26 TaxID=3418997 RepID=UPI003D049BCA
MDAIEQFSFLLFLKRLDEAEDLRERQAKRRKQEDYQPKVPLEMRWRHWTQMKAEDALNHVKNKVFPWLKEMGNPKTQEEPNKDNLETQEEVNEADNPETQEEPNEIKNSFSQYMQTAEFKINKPSLLIEACKAIDEMKISEQNQDVQGDLYEYLLSKLSIAGRNGQFRTPRHIIRMMVEMVEPKPTDRIGDLAAGTCGFLVNAYQYILEKHTSPEILYDDQGNKHLVGDLLTPEEQEFLQTEAFTAYDNDSGMTMLRIGLMNLMLHGIEYPRFFYMDTLSKKFDDEQSLDVVLMNPPVKGAVDAGEVHPKLAGKSKKSELLFLHLILRVLDMGSRCAVIVPDGVLFGSSKAHVEIRRKMIEENRLDGVVSMPAGVFKPYAKGFTSVLLFTRGGTTERIWFYDMEHDGFSLDDKRQPVAANDIPDILNCWKNRSNTDFNKQRDERLALLKEQILPLKLEWMQLHKEINRLSVENVIALTHDNSSYFALESNKQRLVKLDELMTPLQSEINQLNHHFWVNKAQVKANKYDLSASRYRQIENDVSFYDFPHVTLERLLNLQEVITRGLLELSQCFEFIQSSNNLDMYELGELLTSIPYSGIYKPREFIGSGVLLLEIKSLYAGLTIDFSKTKRIQCTDKELEKYQILPGDILINRVSVMPEGVGKAVIVTHVPESTVYESAVMRCRVDLSKIDPWFLVYYLASKESRKELLSKANISNQSSINQEILKSLRVPLPPLELQREIAKVIQNLERFRLQRQEVERQAENLFQTMLHRAFRGELTSSDFNNEAVSALSQEIGVKQAKPKSTDDLAEYIHTKVHQQETETI